MVKYVKRVVSQCMLARTLRGMIWIVSLFAPEAKNMPKQYIFPSLVLLASLITVPVFADGTPGERPVQGPAPLKPDISSSAQTPCQRDCIIPFAPITRHAPVSPPVYQPPVSAPPAPQPARFDFGGFTGGVGSGVGGGYYYGGGGTVILNNAPRYSGVLSHRASVFTFRQRGGGGGGKPHRNPCGGCGGGKAGH